jgi:signal transduction histidine kinase
VKEIAQFHHGTISLESNADIGCKFTITFPAETQEPDIDKDDGTPA